MKKVLFIAICVLGIVCLSSCRTTARSCGLAKNVTLEQIPNQQLNHLEVS